jgi:hypothetical protein
VEGEFIEPHVQIGERGPYPVRLRQQFEALLEGLIAEAAKRDEADLSLISADSTTARASGEGRRRGGEGPAAGVLRKDGTGSTPRAPPREKTEDASGAGRRAGRSGGRAGRSRIIVVLH